MLLEFHIMVVDKNELEEYNKNINIEIWQDFLVQRLNFLDLYELMYFDFQKLTILCQKDLENENFSKKDLNIECN